jgi:hypothetical protein
MTGHAVTAMREALDRDDFGGLESLVQAFIDTDGLSVVDLVSARDLFAPDDRAYFVLGVAVSSGRDALAVPFLWETVNDPRVENGSHNVAATGLANRADPRIENVLLRDLSSRSSDVRARAAWLLAAVGTRATRAAVLTALKRRLKPAARRPNPSDIALLLCCLMRVSDLRELPELSTLLIARRDALQRAEVGLLNFAWPTWSISTPDRPDRDALWTWYSDLPSAGPPTGFVEPTTER